MMADGNSNPNILPKPLYHNHFCIILLCLTALILTFSPPTTAQYAGGHGDPNHPFLIETPEQMNTIGLHPEHFSKHFKLIADIDLAQYTGEQFNIIGPDYQNSFSGVFNGNYHTISNFTYGPTSHSGGLFGTVNDPNAQIINLTLFRPHILSQGAAGAIAISLTSGTISNCGVINGYVVGNWRVGGLVGSTGKGIIKTSYSIADVIGDKYIGGLVGVIYNDPIINCYARGSVSGRQYLGGLVGSKWSAPIYQCYSACRVQSARYSGGLIGGIGSDHNVFQSFWDVDISGYNRSSGGDGKTSNQMKNSYIYRNWGYASVWTIDENNDYPRLAWENQPGTLISKPVPTYGGGAGTPDNPYQIHTPSQFNDIGSYPPHYNKHFILINDIDLRLYSGDNYNIIGIGRLLPFSGTFNGNNHTIYNFNYDLVNQSYNGLFGYLSGADALIQNLVLKNPIINTDIYTGALVGWLNSGTLNNCGVINGDINGRIYVGGLVGWCSYGKINNCFAQAAVHGQDYIGGLVGSNNALIDYCYSMGKVSAANHRAGGLVGINYGLINNSYSRCNVSGSSFLGGLVGAHRNSSINNCYATGTVDGNSWLGGLSGHLWSGSVSNSYATGAVTGNSNVGGFVGSSSAVNIINCYANGKVAGSGDVGGLVGLYDMQYPSVYYKCFWDNTINPALTGIGNVSDPNVIGEITQNLQNQQTFLDVGWDFVNEIANGTEDIWYIYENQSYPRLHWQNHPPLANAGPDQTVYTNLNGFARVTLDASASSDPDGDSLTYQWSWTVAGQTYSSTGCDGIINLLDFTHLTHKSTIINPVDLFKISQSWLTYSTQPNFNPLYDTALTGPFLTLLLPVDTHTITLIVSDGIDNSEPDQVVITVFKVGDLDHNGVVNQDDLMIILAARNMPADGPDDPRDLDHDGLITVLDARILVTLFDG